MNLFKRLTPVTTVLYLVCFALMAAAVFLTIQFFISGVVVKMLAAFVLIGIGWYLGAVATINLRPADDGYNQQGKKMK